LVFQMEWNFLGFTFPPPAPKAQAHQARPQKQEAGGYRGGGYAGFFSPGETENSALQLRVVVNVIDESDVGGLFTDQDISDYALFIVDIQAFQVADRQDPIVFQDHPFPFGDGEGVEGKAFGRETEPMLGDLVAGHEFYSAFSQFRFPFQASVLGEAKNITLATF
jgi:hypothetical protein